MRELANQQFALDQHAIVSIADTRRRIIHVNDKFCQVSGYSRAELIGGSYAILNSGHHPQAYFDQLWRTVEGGEVWHGEVSNLAKGGRRYWINATVVPCLDGQGDPYQYVAIETDITENKLLAEIAATSEREYRSLVDRLQEVVFKTDARACLTFFNPAWSEITGYSVDETLGRPLLDVVHHDDRDWVGRQFTRLIAGAAPSAQFEMRCRRRDGSVRWLDVHVRGEVDARAGIAGLSGRLHDVSERHRAAEQIRENLSFVDALFDSIPIPICLKDADGRYMRINQAYSQFFAMSEEQLSGKTVRAVRNQEAVDIHEQNEGLVIETGVTRTYEDALELADGRHVDLQVSKAVLRRADGGVRGVIGVAVDITAQKAALRAIQSAKEAADAASRAKGDFLANMSHEIRTPLNSVIGMALLALKNATDPQQRDYLGKILASGEHLLDLINDILDFSKIEAGMLTLEDAAFDLERVLDNVLAQVADPAQAKGLALRRELGAGVGRSLRGDALRLSQVLINLAGNAVKFTSAGQVALRVRLLGQDAASCQLHFEVEDSGIGMSPPELAKLFGSFHQADASITRKYGGTGLGLAISKRIVEQMGGTIGVESAPGRGSRFWFTLRLEKEARPDQHGAASRAPQDLGALFGMRVLVADDNAFNRQVATEFLEHVGVQVTVAGNGEEALERLRQACFDCVLMDLQMPVLDGLEATRRIRAEPGWAGLRVVAMTANARAEDRARCLAAGMDDFITKPVSPHKLYAALDGRALPAEPAPARPASPSSPAEAIQLAILARNFDGMPERMQQFARRYVETARAGVDEAEAALARCDLALPAVLGHRYKSSALAVGALAMAEQWEALEQLAQQPDSALAAALVAPLRGQLAQVEQWIAAGFADGAPS